MVSVSVRVKGIEPDGTVTSDRVWNLPFDEESGIFTNNIDGPIKCIPRHWEYWARAVTASGKVYDAQDESGWEKALADRLPTERECVNLGGSLGGSECKGLHFAKVHPLYCEGVPGQILLGVTAFGGRFVTLERAGDGGPIPIAEIDLSTVSPKGFRVPVDIRGLPSGDILVHGRMSGGGLAEPVDDEHAIPIDTVPPTPEILFPVEDGQLCLSPDPVTGREIGTFLVEVADTAPTVMLSSAQYRYEDGPWIPFAPICLDGAACAARAKPEFPILPTGRARRIGWDATGRGEGNHTVRFRFCDEDGNTTTVERRVVILREPPAVTLDQVVPDGGIFSPNGDERRESATVTVSTYQATQLSAEIRVGDSRGAVVRTFPVTNPALPGNHVYAWDGRDASGATVPDGSYVLVVSAQDACGVTGRLPVPLLVDKTPPVAVISRPAAHDPVNASLDVLGAATDAHFASYELTYGLGPAPTEWLPIATAAYPVKAGGRLGRWHTPGVEDTYTLRLVAWDLAENEAEIQIPVEVTQSLFLGRLSAEPAIFSPNGDGRRDTSTIDYELLGAVRVALDVVTPQGAVVRTFVSGQEQTPGTHTFVWDGLADDGTDAPDGDYDVRIRLESVSGTGGSQQATAALIVDRVPPSVTIARPTPDAFLTRSDSVKGSITDLHLSSYGVWVRDAAATGDGTSIAVGVQNREDADLGPLASLTDGAYRLRVRADDLAENETTLELPFNVDTVPPRVAFETPAANAILDKLDPVDVRGLVIDENLDHHTLSFGAGAAPSFFDTIARGATGGESIALAAWMVSSLPDGDYTLKLEGVDRANQSAETLRTVTLDGTPPDAAIDDPAEGGWVTKPRPIIGTASDQNLESWALDVAPGDAGAASEWSPIGAGTANVVAGQLTMWDPLPPDGVYTLRLTVTDKVGHVSRALRTVKVDQTPPAPPVVAGKIIAADREAKTATIEVAWEPNTEPDLAGYKVSREGELLTPEIITVTAYDDPGRPEGVHAYEVVALDLAGNVSLPGPTKVKVDLTPPFVEIQRPEAGAVVSGTVDIRGTAWSHLDFKEYRLYIGATEAPTTWTLLARSTLPVVAGVLGTWDALEDGLYVIALEGEDLDGNQARVTSPVIVDTLPPEPPVLVSVVNTPEATTLTSTWLASPSPDVDGYLVYRGGRLANAPGIVLGDLREFLVPGLTHPDTNLPDGRYCYRIVAMDGAGNVSVPSNEICESLDNRPPRAVIVDPPNGTRFEYPIRVVADSEDNDIASVQFQIKPHAGDTWTDLNAADLDPTWETTLDPISLELGDYDLRAVATDEGGRTDADPPSITVTYGDATPPLVLIDLIARVDGRNVHLTWEASAADDLVGYHVFRDGARITTEPVPEPVYDDDRDPGKYQYAVTAIDEDDNESVPSEPAQAVVYQPRLFPPDWPVTLEAAATLSGEWARPETTIQILSGDTVIAEAAAGESAFEVPDVPLSLEGNIFRARGIDAAGNRSIPSEEIVVIRNVPPGPVTGLAANVADHDVTLTWDASTDADRHGHLVKRDETALTPSSRISDGLDASANSTYSWCYSSGGYRPCYAYYAIDGLPGTSWIPWSDANPAIWTVTFPTARVNRVVLSLAPDSEASVIAEYRLEALWEGRYLLVARVQGNTQRIVEHAFPSPFATESLRIVYDARPYEDAGLAEVEIWKVDALPADATTYQDAAVDDGYHDYDLRAIDRYGAESEPAPLRVAVGDVEPPAAPITLVAAVETRDVHLTWTANTEPDLEEYLVYRDGEEIGTSPIPEYVDAQRPNGEYTYVVAAVDRAGNESAPSNEAVAVVAVPLPAPVIYFPTDAAHPITTEATRTDVQGWAEHGDLVALDLNGEPVGWAPALPAFAESGRTSLDKGNRDLVFSRNARRVAYQVQYLNPEYGGIDQTYDGIHVLDRATGATDRVLHNGSGYLWSQELSPDGGRLAYLGYVWDPVLNWSGPRLFVRDLATGALAELASGAHYTLAHAWSPDGARMVVALSAPSTGAASLDLWNPATGSRTTLIEEGQIPYVDSIEWSPDGTRLAVAAGSPSQIYLVDAATGAQTAVASGRIPRWSGDGQSLVYVADDDRVVLRTLSTGESRAFTEPGTWSRDPRLDATGRWLSYRSGDCPSSIWIAATDHDQRYEIPVGMLWEEYCYWPETTWTPEGRLAVTFPDDHIGLFSVEDGFFSFPDVALSPGENVFVARSEDLAAGLTSPDSEPVLVTVSESSFPDLEVTVAGLTSSPAVPVAGQAAIASARVANVGEADASEVEVALVVVDPLGAIVTRREVTIAEIGAEAVVPLSLTWTPAAAGRYRLGVVVDDRERIVEAREDNNRAARDLDVLSVSGVITADITADRNLYPAASPAVVSVSVLNSGPAVAGTLRTTVEDAAGGLVAVLDQRAASLAYGESLAYALGWNTGRTYAGDYVFRVRLVPAEGEATLATDTWPFAIASDLALTARLVPRQPRIVSGSTAILDARIENGGTNSPLVSGVARLRMRAAGTTDPILFEATARLATLLPGGLFTSAFSWPATVPAGLYDAELAVFRAGEPILATAQASLEVVAENVSFGGTLTLSPDDILVGEATDAEVTLTNRSGVDAAALLVAVEVAEGPTATVLVRATTTLDLAAGETRTLTVPLDTSAVTRGLYPAFLKVGEPARTLDRALLGVHGMITPPVIYSPPDGARVATSHPDLVVTNAESAEDAPLTYEFEIYANAALTMALPGARDIPEATDRTAWTVTQNLTEDRTYYWRARATDGFSMSAWTEVASFTVDADHVPPMAPVPESPVPGERVTSLQPLLVVLNSYDPDSPVLTYDFRLATDPDMTTILASATDLPEGPAYTSWQVPATLTENATYYWCARARDESSYSPWSPVVSFIVDTVNESPTAPVPLRPELGERLLALTTTLVVANAADPEGLPLTYRFQIDSVPTFDSPALQEASGIAETPAETSWAPPGSLIDHTTYYWRSAASDEVTYGPWGQSEFFVNLANEPPTAPIPLAPGDGEIVTTLMPELRVRNATDPDGDELTYDFTVLDGSGNPVASVTGIEEGSLETAWTLPNPLVENASYSWTARAQDPELPGPWTNPWHFRVNAVQQPPTAPTLFAPPEGAVLDIRRPDLVVRNATSPEGLPLTYTFELSSVAPDGTLTLLERVEGIAEGAGTTSWTPSSDLPDGSYSWTARAKDPDVFGPWMDAAHFSVAVDLPPSPPTGLVAVPGDTQVTLTWNPNPEPDVVGYRVYRSFTSGGPYIFIAETVVTHLLDTGLENGVTVYYVVTALDARFESGYSAEAAATPFGASETLTAEVRYEPDEIEGECLFVDDCRHRKRKHHHRNITRIGHGPTCDPQPSSQCPAYLKASIELPVGHDPATIDIASVLLAGSVSPEPDYSVFKDDDADGLLELHLKFDLDDVAPFLKVGSTELILTGRTATAEFRGSDTVVVKPLRVGLWISPRTLQKRACGQDILAHLTFRGCVDPHRVTPQSLRLNGVVPAGRVVSDQDHHLIVKFDRKDVIKILPTGHHVEVVVSGTLDGIPFSAVDHIRVME